MEIIVNDRLTIRYDEEGFAGYVLDGQLLDGDDDDSEIRREDADELAGWIPIVREDDNDDAPLTVLLYDRTGQPWLFRDGETPRVLSQAEAPFAYEFLQGLKTEQEALLRVCEKLAPDVEM